MRIRTSTRLALAFAGAGLALAGGVLLVRAAWVGLAIALGPVWAFAIVGGGLCLAGAVCLALGRTPAAPPRVAPEAALLSAFFDGLRAGRAARAR